MKVAPLHELNLSGNLLLGDDVVAAQVLRDWLPQTQLTVLDLDDCGIGQEPGMVSYSRSHDKSWP